MPHDAPEDRRPPLTKIVATVGPASEDPKVIERMVEAGARVFRLNFSHGSFADHERRLRAVRSVARETGEPLAILGDLPGPKIRIGEVPAGVEGGIVLRAGQDAEIRPDAPISRDGERPVLACNYPKIHQEVQPGERVLINDGAIRMLCVEAGAGRLLCRVTVGGLVTSRKGVNLPDSDLTLPAVTEKDWECVLWAVEHDLDYLALSFVRRGEDVAGLRRRIEGVCTRERCGSGLDLGEGAPAIPIIAKIETPQGVANIDDIAGEADAVMVARGDLGVELDMARVPVIQKRLIAKAHEHGRPCIVATQMLESMIDRPTATRAEVSDVANAIIDGADAVMLSGETAVGKYPALAVETMRRVALATEEESRSQPQSARPPARPRESRDRIAALCHGAWHMARDVDAKLLVIWSQRGGGARYLSRLNFRIPILAFSSDERAVRRMALLHGVRPIHVPQAPEHRSDFARMADSIVLDLNLAELGEAVILLAGKPLDAPGSLNTVAVRYAGELASGE